MNSTFAIRTKDHRSGVPTRNPDTETEDEKSYLKRMTVQIIMLNCLNTLNR